jgi:predicted dehydrogenase
MNIGILGAGSMGRAHQKAIAAYGARVVAVHDVSLEAAEHLASEASIAQSETLPVATDRLEEFFDRPLDGVVIATPPPVRLEPVRMACARGVHLMIEKPPALTLAEGRACQAEIERAEVIAAVGFQLRYSPLYERLKEMLAGQTVHLVRTVCTIDYYLNFRMSPWFLQSRVSGGPIAEQAIHLLDCVRYLLGDPAPVQATAIGARNMALDRTEFDAENALQITYELANGVFGAHMNHCGTERFRFDLEVVGPHLALQANVTENRITGYLSPRPLRHGEGAGPAAWQNDRGGADVDEPAPPENSLGLDKTGAWLRAIETGDRTLVRAPYVGSLDTLALVEAAVRSLREGRFIPVGGGS